MDNENRHGRATSGTWPIPRKKKCKSSGKSSKALLMLIVMAIGVKAFVMALAVKADTSVGVGKKQQILKGAKKKIKLLTSRGVKHRRYKLWQVYKSEVTPHLRYVKLIDRKCFKLKQCNNELRKIISSKAVKEINTKEQHDKRANGSPVKQGNKLPPFLENGISSSKDTFEDNSADKYHSRKGPPGYVVDEDESKFSLCPKIVTSLDLNVFEKDNTEKYIKPLDFIASDDDFAADDMVKCNKQQNDILHRVRDIILHPTRHVFPGKFAISPVVYPIFNLTIHSLMRYEILRIKSYNRHSTMPIYSVAQLAQNGFYLSGKDGEVTCFNCEVSHKHFLADVALDRTAHQENCENDRPLKNVALFMGTRGLTAEDLNLFHTIYGDNRDSEKQFIQQETANDTQVYFMYTSNTKERPVGTIPNSNFLRVYKEGYNSNVGGIDANFLDLTSAAYPLFANRKTRKETFHSWDPTHNQKPDDLVNLGFFYAGYSDCARCFYCGLGLKYWRPNDDAAFQHARFRPQCKYNLFVKGQAYVDHVQRSIAAEPQGASANTDATEVPNIEQLMTSDAARQVLAEGWSQQDVRAGVVQLIRDLGEECLVYDILLEILNNLQIESSGASATTSTPKTDEPHDAAPGSQDNAEDIRPTHVLQDADNANASASENSATEVPSALEPELLLRLLEREHNYLKKRLYCLVCSKNKIGCIYLPCGHVVACQTCGDNASTCILCNKVISAMASVFLS